MKVRMKVDMSGTHNGRPWPPRGGDIDLPDGIAAKLCASGQAIPVPARATEQATADTSVFEARTGPAEPPQQPKRRGRPPGTKNKSPDLQATPETGKAEDRNEDG